MRKLLILTAVLLAVPTLALALEAQPKQLPAASIGRFQAGISGYGKMTEDTGGARVGSAEADVWGSYSLASLASASASYSYDFTSGNGATRAGVRAILPHAADDRYRLAFGTDYVRYEGERPAWAKKWPGSWSASLLGSWQLVQDKAKRTVIYLVGRAEYDTDNDLKTYRLGVRLPIVRGAAP